MELASREERLTLPLEDLVNKFQWLRRGTPDTQACSRREFISSRIRHLRICFLASCLAGSRGRRGPARQALTGQVACFPSGDHVSASACPALLDRCPSGHKHASGPSPTLPLGLRRPRVPTFQTSPSADACPHRRRGKEQRLPAPHMPQSPLRTAPPLQVGAM